MDSLEASLDRIFKNYASPNPGAAISIIKNGEAYTKCYGIANMENDTPVTSHTNFRLASVTKAFTAMCVMILAEQGKIQYDDALRELIPEFPRYADKITIKQMLHHTSGIARSIVPDQYPGQLRDRDILKLHLRLDTPEYEPGTKMQYSDDAYVLLGIIVERLSGLSFSDFMDREIFRKIGIKNSVLHNEGVTRVKNRAYGYTKFLDGYGFCDQSQTSLVL